MEPITIAVRLTFWERYRLSAYLFLRAFRFFLLVVVPIALIFLLLLSYVVLFPSPDHTFGQLMASFGPTPYVFLGLVVVFGGAPLLMTWSSYSNPRTREVTSFIISEDGVEIENSVASASLKWEAFMRATETRHFFLVFVAKGLAHAWPKCLFVGDDSLKLVRELLRQKITKAKLRP